MPMRSPSPKHFMWWSRTSFVDVITQSSFVGSGGSLQQSVFAAPYPSWPSPLSRSRPTAAVRALLQERVQDVFGPPNAAPQPLPEAEARHERTLEAVGCRRLFGPARPWAHGWGSLSYGSGSTSGTWAKAASYFARLPRLARSSR